MQNYNNQQKGNVIFMPKRQAIAAVSTPRAAGGIAVIRISGKDSLDIAGEIFQPVSTDKSPAEMSGYTCAYGKIFDGENYVDDVVLTVFKAPRSYTGEDVAEISCHGGIFVTERILQLIFSSGARPAEAGEFTKLAFLNGKMSLTQAEAVMDIISAQGRASHKCAAALREGALFSRIKSVSEDLLHLLGELAAWVDYPEDDIPEVSEENMTKTLESVLARLNETLETYDCGRILREGVDTVIVGKPNVGKSTIMNMLSGCERSIVTDIAGTTRDIVEETVRLGDIVLRLSDTAGIRETEDIVEGVGVERANRKLETAELILAVFDNSDELSTEDIELVEKCRGRNAVAVINKTDKQPKLDRNYIDTHFQYVTETAACKGEGLAQLQNVLETMFNTNSIDLSSGIIANERQRDCVKRAVSLVDEALQAVRAGETLDAVTIILDEAENALLELTGERATEAVVDEIFSHFCVGK